MKKETVTIYDVAREAGVSMATVSRVVNGNPNVRPSTRRQVTEVIERLNYRPNAVARGLASSKTTTVGVIIPNVADLFFASLARGIDDIATMYKYNIILTNSDGSVDREVQVFNTLLAQQVDGIIYMGEDVNDRLKDLFDSSSTPVVVAGTPVSSESIYSVNIDLTEAFYDVTKIILKNKNRVALVTPPAHYLASSYQLAGYQKALEEAGIDYDQNIVFQQEAGWRDGEKIAKQLQNHACDGAVVAGDTVAVAVMNELIEEGIDVPDQFEIISSQNTLVSSLSRPKLTSIQQPVYDIGAVAMRLLTKIMNNEEVDEKQVILPYHIIERGTSKTE